MKVYLATSWKNERYAEVLANLRERGHEVYDFREEGFNWSWVDPDYADVQSPRHVREMLSHHLALGHFAKDMTALEEADAVVLIQPCGNDAHLELGWAVGARKVTFVLQEAGAPVGLMYNMTDGLTEDLLVLAYWLIRAEREASDQIRTVPPGGGEAYLEDES